MLPLLPGVRKVARHLDQHMRYAKVLLHAGFEL